MIGTVKWFDSKRGYGFIASENQGDFFVHHSEIVMEGFRALKPDQMVEFDIDIDDKGRRKAVGVVVKGDSNK